MKWWIYIIIFLVGQLAGGFAGGILSNLFHLAPESTMAVALVLANVLSICLALLFKPAWLSASAEKNRFTLLALLMALPVIVLVNLLLEILPELPSIIDETQLNQIIDNPLGVLAIVVLAPVAEELLFRAGVLGGLLKRDAKRSVTEGQSHPWLAVIWSALFFSIAHMNPAQMPVAFILGILLGWAYWRTGSLLAPCLIHMLNNGLAVGLALAYDSPDVKLSQVLGGEVGVAVVFGVAVLWLGVCLHKAVQAEHREHRPSDVPNFEEIQ